MASDETTHPAAAGHTDSERDPFAPINASPRFSGTLAALSFVLAVATVFSGLVAVVGPVGMAVGLIAHVKGSRFGLPATIACAVAMVVGMALTMYMR